MSCGFRAGMRHTPETHIQAIAEATLRLSHRARAGPFLFQLFFASSWSLARHGARANRTEKSREIPHRERVSVSGNATLVHSRHLAVEWCAGKSVGDWLE